MERTTRHIAGIYYGILTLVLLFGLLFISDVNCEKGRIIYVFAKRMCSFKYQFHETLILNINSLVFSVIL